MFVDLEEWLEYSIMVFFSYTRASIVDAVVEHMLSILRRHADDYRTLLSMLNGILYEGG